MICFPNCKINIGLFITQKRDDGYHDLETVFYPISGQANKSVLNDVLEIVPIQGEPRLHLSGLTVNGDIENNIVWKAYQLLRKDFGEKIPALDIYLHKVVPMGAGLGGGSADGTYMLRLLNDYCQLGIPASDMIDYALQLGSDCPFFLYDTPQFATGRGEKMTPTNVSLSGYDIQIICPDVHVSMH